MCLTPPPPNTHRQAQSNLIRPGSVFENILLHHSILCFSKQVSSKLAINMIIIISISTRREECLCSGNPFWKSDMIAQSTVNRVSSDLLRLLPERDLINSTQIQRGFCLKKVENKALLIGRGLKKSPRHLWPGTWLSSPTSWPSS